MKRITLWSTWLGLSNTNDDMTYEAGDSVDGRHAGTRRDIILRAAGAATEVFKSSIDVLPKAALAAVNPRRLWKLKMADGSTFFKRHRLKSETRVAHSAAIGVVAGAFLVRAAVLPRKMQAPRIGRGVACG